MVLWMEKTSIFINDLIKANNYKSYLELGVDIGTTWPLIEFIVDSKTGG